jgi:hypothetical protein
LTESVVILDEATGRVSLGATRHDADVVELKGSMLGVLMDASEGLTEAELGKQVEGRAKVKREAIRALVVAGQVERQGTGRRNNPYRYTVSPSLVPAISREQEIEKSKTAKIVDKQASDSRSQDLGLLQVTAKPAEEKPDAAADVFEVA